MIGRSRIQLHAVRKSALPLENRKIYQIYQNCLSEMKIRKTIPIYSAAFLTSPVIDGLFLPRVYVPLPLISDCRENELRYILLHELQHYRRRDALVNYLMAAAGVLYWFNPIVWFAFKQIRTDREIACDTSVLEIIGEDSRIDYGNTLINFAEKISFSPFQFSLGINGNAAQIRKRILNIAGYRPATVRRKLYGLLSCVLTAILLSGFLPALSSRAADTDRYHGRENGRNISDLDLSTYFGAYDGSFVLYEAASDSWQLRLTRSTAPCSAFSQASSPGRIRGYPGTGRIMPSIPGTRTRLWNLPCLILSHGIFRRSTAGSVFPLSIVLYRKSATATKLSAAAPRPTGMIPL